MRRIREEVEEERQWERQRERDTRRRTESQRHREVNAGSEEGLMLGKFLPLISWWEQRHKISYKVILLLWRQRSFCITHSFNVEQVIPYTENYATQYLYLQAANCRLSTPWGKNMIWIIYGRETLKGIACIRSHLKHWTEASRLSIIKEEATHPLSTIVQFSFNFMAQLFNIKF